jgi:hypothetical protein
MTVFQESCCPCISQSAGLRHRISSPFALQFRPRPDLPSRSQSPPAQSLFNHKKLHLFTRHSRGRAKRPGTAVMTRGQRVKSPKIKPATFLHLGGPTAIPFGPVPRKGPACCRAYIRNPRLLRSGLFQRESTLSHGATICSRVSSCPSVIRNIGSGLIVSFCTQYLL